MARVLFTIDEALPAPSGRIAGLQVRVLEMSRALARAGLEIAIATPEDAAAAAPADVWITHPRLVAALEGTVRARALVVDGYESPFGSFLAQAASLLPRIGDRAVRDYRATVTTMLGAIACADRILAANDAQRVSYLTILSMLGRVGPRTPATDVVFTVASGASPSPPTRPGDDVPHAPVLLWCGGAYPWFDVETYLAALPAIVRAVPDVRLRFAGIDGVAEADVLPLARRIREALAAAPDLGSRAELVPWRAYEERGALYAAADVGVCTYGAHLETALAMRTRVIDMVWGGLPLVVSSGDEMSRTVEREGLGVVVPPGAAAALAAAVTGLLRDPVARRTATARARALATGALSWDAQVVPLAAYCTAVATGRHAPVPRPSVAEAIVRLNDGHGRQMADALRQLAWRAGNAWRLARRHGLGPALRRVWP